MKRQPRSKRFSRRLLTLESLESRELLTGDFRSIDGSGNNQTPNRNDWGAAGTNLIRFGYPGEYPDGFGDQIVNSPNPRVISNTISAQSEAIYNDRNLSDWHVQWGQFLTHDLDLTGTDAANNQLSTGAVGDFSISVPAGDILGPNAIPFNRSNFDPTTGDNTRINGPGNGGRLNWREQINEITSFIDASNVYGSDSGRAAALRTFVDGKLETSANGLLPGLNDVGEENDNPLRHDPTDLFLAGDVRANEQIGLTATHALFVREHNRLAELIKHHNPAFSDEEIYQWARKIVGAEMQIISYEEYLPALMGTSAPNPHAYSYSTNVDPTITNSFSAAFFRFAHSMQSSTLQLTNNDGSPAGEFSLANIFFNPDLLKQNPNLVDQVVKGLASQVAQENDTMLVDEVRNFLFGPPGAGGLDLAALDVQRGRDHGLIDYNEARRTYDLPRFNNFNQITSDLGLQTSLRTLYSNNINSIDAWVGALAEDHMAGQSIGSMLNASFADQFSRLRDGDRYFYTGDPDLDDPVVTEIIDLDNFTLAQVIRNNSGISNIQDNVFFTAAGFRVIADGTLQVDESGDRAASFEVVLNKAPGNNVVFDIASSDPGESSPGTSRLTFTSTNWHIPQRVTVQGVDDGAIDGDILSTLTISINAALSNNEFDALLSQSVTVETIDDDFPGLIVVETDNSTQVTEDGNSDSITVQLGSQPSSSVLIDLSLNNDEVILGESQLTFSPSNWDRPQMVSVDANDDGLIESLETSQLTLSVLDAQSSPEYGAVEDTIVTIMVHDNDFAGFVLSETDDTTVVHESGSTDMLAVVLSAQPQDDEVVLQITSSNVDEVVSSISRMTFTADNWNQPQQVLLTGVDDLFADGDITSQISVSVVTEESDAAWSGVGNQSISVITRNDDEAGYTLTPPNGSVDLVEQGSGEDFSIVLDSRPLSDVVFQLYNSDSSEVLLSQNTITFTSANWDQPQLVEVSPLDDPMVDGSQAFEIRVSIQADESDAAFIELADQTLAGTVADNDVASFSLQPTGTGTSVVENGPSDTVTLVLDRQPQGNVVIRVSSSDAGEATPSTDTVTFTNANWDQPQSIAILPVDDPAVDGTQVFEIQVHVDDGSDPAFSNLDSQVLPVSTMDDEVAGVQIVESDNATQVGENGDSDDLFVSLSAQPLGTVAIAVTSSDSTEVTTSLPTLSFNSSNWNVSQMITLFGENDALLDGNQISEIQFSIIDAASEDAWDDLPDENISVVTIDDEQGELVVVQTGSSTVVNERGSVDTVEVRLNFEPTTDVVLNITSSDESEAIHSPSTITFTPEDWLTPKTITLTGVDDRLADNHQESQLLISVDELLSDDAFDDASAHVVTVTTHDDPFEINISSEDQFLPELVGGASLGPIVIESATGEGNPILTLSDPRLEVFENSIRIAGGEYLEFSQEENLRLIVRATAPNNVVVFQQEVFNISVQENPTPAHNSKNPLDVNDDGFVSAIDALLVINLLNIGGSSDQSVNFAQADSSWIFPDTSADKFATAIDALLVIAELNNANGEWGEGEASSKLPQLPASNLDVLFALDSVYENEDEEEQLIDQLASDVQSGWL